MSVVTIGSTSYSDVEFSTTTLSGAAALIIEIPYSGVDMDEIASVFASLPSTITIDDDTYTGYTVYVGMTYDGDTVKTTIRQLTEREQIAELESQILELQAALAEVATA